MHTRPTIVIPNLPYPLPGGNNRHLRRWNGRFLRGNRQLFPGRTGRKRTPGKKFGESPSRRRRTPTRLSCSIRLSRNPRARIAVVPRSGGPPWLSFASFSSWLPAEPRILFSPRREKRCWQGSVGTWQKRSHISNPDTPPIGTLCHPHPRIRLPENKVL